MELWRPDGVVWYKEPAAAFPEAGFVLERLLQRYRLPLGEPETRFLVFNADEREKLSALASALCVNTSLASFLAKVFVSKYRAGHKRYNTWVDSFVYISDVGPQRPESGDEQSVGTLAYGMDMLREERYQSRGHQGVWWFARP